MVLLYELKVRVIPQKKYLGQLEKYLSQFITGRADELRVRAEQPAAPVRGAGAGQVPLPAAAAPHLHHQARSVHHHHLLQPSLFVNYRVEFPPTNN